MGKELDDLRGGDECWFLAGFSSDTSRMNREQQGLYDEYSRVNTFVDWLGVTVIEPRDLKTPVSLQLQGKENHRD